nr:MAG TPA: hypothetical protein [Caudoviricetes sp.]
MPGGTNTEIETRRSSIRKGIMQAMFNLYRSAGSVPYMTDLDRHRFNNALDELRYKANQAIEHQNER